MDIFKLLQVHCRGEKLEMVKFWEIALKLMQGHIVIVKKWQFQTFDPVGTMTQIFFNLGRYVLGLTWSNFETNDIKTEAVLHMDSKETAIWLLILSAR